MRIGLVGNFWDHASPIEASASAAATASIRVFMMFFLPGN
jgi:hypothetical protein